MHGLGWCADRPGVECNGRQGRLTGKVVPCACLHVKRGISPKRRSIPDGRKTRKTRCAQTVRVFRPEWNSILGNSTVLHSTPGQPLPPAGKTRCAGGLGAYGGRMAGTGCWILDGEIPQNGCSPCNRTQNRSSKARFLRPVAFRGSDHFGGISYPKSRKPVPAVRPPYAPKPPAHRVFPAGGSGWMHNVFTNRRQIDCRFPRTSCGHPQVLFSPPSHLADPSAPHSVR